MRRAALFLLLGAAVAACREPVPRPPSPPPAVDRPAAAIPGDLDVAIRLDVVAARRFFGAAIGNALQVDLVDPKTDAETAKLLEGALARADVVWVALRPGQDARHTDNVLVLRGNFAGIEPPRAGAHPWEPPADLGAGFRLYRRPRPERRSAPARLYARADDWLVFVSEAEVDAAERSIERRAGDDHMDPKERGMVSVAARAPALVPFLAEGYPLVAEALSAARRVDAEAEADDRGLRASFEVTYATEPDAKEGKARLDPLLERLRGGDGSLGLLARGTETSVLGSSFVVHTTLNAADVSRLLQGSPPSQDRGRTSAPVSPR